MIYELIDGYLKCKVSLLEAKQAINFLDLAAMTFQEDAKFYQPKEQEAIPEMAGFSGYYVACGQPIYANSFFLGMEFPLAENHLEEGRSLIHISEPTRQEAKSLAVFSLKQTKEEC